jgi:hypothetical protein
MAYFGMEGDPTMTVGVLDELIREAERRPLFCLTVQQHKGRTLMEWSEAKNPLTELA